MKQELNVKRLIKKMYLKRFLKLINDGALHRWQSAVTSDI